MYYILGFLELFFLLVTLHGVWCWTHGKEPIHGYAVKAMVFGLVLTLVFGILAQLFTP